MDKKETTWSNMIKMMKIILLQFRPAILCITVLMPALILLWNLVETYSNVSDDPVPWQIYLSGSSNSSSMELLIVLAFLLVAGCHVLSRNEISMFPGTVISRYGGTILAYHVIIVIAALVSAVTYLLQGGILWILGHVWSNCIPVAVIYPSYLWHGIIRYLAILLAVTSIGIFWFLLMERFRTFWVCLCTMLLFAGLALLIRLGYLIEILQAVINLIRGDGYSYAVSVAACFGIWAVMMILSAGLARTVTVWKETDRTRVSAVIFLIYLVAIGTVWFQLEERESDYELELFERQSERQAEVVVDISDWDETNPMWLGDYEMTVNYQNEQGKSSTNRNEVFATYACSASEAKQQGLQFDESKLDQDHAIMLLSTKNLIFAGQDLGEGVVRAYGDSAKLVEDLVKEEELEGDSEEEQENDLQGNPEDDLEESLEEDSEEDSDKEYSYQTEIKQAPIYVINGFYGNLAMYLDDTTLNENRMLWGNDMGVATEQLLRLVIYPDNKRR